MTNDLEQFQDYRIPCVYVSLTNAQQSVDPVHSVRTAALLEVEWSQCLHVYPPLSHPWSSDSVREQGRAKQYNTTG